ERIAGEFHHIQFTPDLLPSDITGTEIFRPQEGSFTFQPGPIFHNLVLADEINRAPAKVQSALLEAMGERQISVGPTTHNLPELFMVMATQNPIEQEGTYPLPEAQLDRFLMHVTIDYPDAQSEHRIINLARQEAKDSSTKSQSQNKIQLPQEVLFSARKEVLDIHMAQEVEEYIVQLVMASRNPSAYDEDFASWIEYGISPRGSIALDRCSKSLAWLDGRDFVTPADVQSVAHDTLRHRIGITYDAEARGMNKDTLVDELLNRVTAP
ncbi:MAG: MoxR family ATPase, partial [Pseudomonadales bacterium]|nr:MoxR family ATPase [Pseudomonadales bacterium]